MKRSENDFKAMQKVDWDATVQIASKKSKTTHEKYCKDKKHLKKSEISHDFRYLCSIYGYKVVPIPTKVEFAKAMKVQKLLAGCASLAEVMECMIKHWRMLSVLGDTKPRVPKLGLLPNVLHEVFDIMSANHTELVQQITKPDFTEALDSYINEMMEG